MTNEFHFQEFKQRIDQGILSHAYILNGLDSTELKETMQAILLYYYCQNPNKQNNGSCRSCPNCLAILNHEFAGVSEINDHQQMIKIDQVRDLTNSADYSDLGQKAKFFVIQHAELMNENAQNALLKHLESPGSDRYFFLLTRNLHLLLPTIKSRTEVVYFGAEKSSFAELTHPTVDEFVRLLRKKNPMAYVLLTTEMKSIIKELGEEFVLYALWNAYRKTDLDAVSAVELSKLNKNLPRLGYQLDFQRLMEKFCIEVLSED
ncbi:hypothetical protein [Xylocopilactobacillus apicola]|uniref:DNA polymerase III subunit delta n=1 Tax=Xylocopilactobacillus apicola TaxID=2932184 RepID=A0AAU9DXC8_9LACO|nr:hypothetical protein [Xylocopilactobacillus apicola]BDR58773.1 hypothetical protein XA3_12140 [Xylocopilactobacillus apicola]